MPTTPRDADGSAVLHYGSDVRIRLDTETARLVMEAIGAHATRGGWVTVSDDEGRSWSLLITPGIPIWIMA